MSIFQIHFIEGIFNHTQLASDINSSRTSLKAMMTEFAYYLYTGIQPEGLISNSWNQNTLRWIGQYYSYWCPGSLCHQVISNHGIDDMINRSLSSTWKNFYFLHQLRSEKWKKMSIIFLCFLKYIHHYKGWRWCLNTSKLLDHSPWLFYYYSDIAMW